MKKLFIVLVSTLFLNSLGFSQDIITKISGEDIKAKVLEVEQFDVKYKRFDNLDGPVFTMQKAEILMIRYENGTKDIFNNTPEVKFVTVKPTYNTQARKFQGFSGNGEGMNPGYHFNADVGYYIGSGDWGMDRLGLNMTCSNQFSPFFSFGLGTGLRAYLSDESDGVILMPVYANFKGFFLDNNISPYLSFSIGYSADLSGYGCGGLFLSPQLGANIRLNDRFSVNVGLGYEMQKMELYFHNYYSGSYYYSVENNGAVCFNVGFTF